MSNNIIHWVKCCSHFIGNNILPAVNKSIAALTTFFTTTICLFSNATVQSESGVQQYNPLGQVLFSLTFWPLILKIRELVPNFSSQHTSYLSDVIVAGTEQQLNQTLQILLNGGPRRGFFLRKQKYENTLNTEVLWIDNGVTRHSCDGFELLRAPIRTDK